VANVIAGRGVHGMTSAATGWAVYGEATGSGTTGVYGESAAGSGWGVYGVNGSSGIGVEGVSSTGIAGKFRLSLAGTSIISAFDGGTEVFTVDDGGNVGVGITAPTSLLHLYGSAPTLGIETSNTTITVGDVLGTLEFSGLDATVTDQVGAKIVAEADLGWDATTNDAPTSLKFYTQSNGGTDALGTERMIINAKGYVGIGSSLPSGLLELYSSIASNNPSLYINQGNAGGDASMKFGSTTNTISMGIDATDGSFKISDFGTLGTNDRMVMNTSGDVDFSERVTGKMKFITNHAYSTADAFADYIPLPGYIVEQGSISGYTARWIAPYGGELLKVLIEYTGVVNSTTISFHTNRNTTAIETETVIITSSNTVYTATFSSSSFNAGDELHIKVDPLTDYGTLYPTITCVWEYDTAN
jgi:hypothetical protein